MTKFIGVSLILLIVSSMASAVVIESPASHMVEFMDRLAQYFVQFGFTSGAILDRYSYEILGKTAAFKASPPDIKDIVRIVDNIRT